MRCSVCLKSGEKSALSVFGFELCPACLDRLTRQSAARREYDWYAGFVRRGLVEPLLENRRPSNRTGACKPIIPRSRACRDCTGTQRRPS